MTGSHVTCLAVSYMFFLDLFKSVVSGRVCPDTYIRVKKCIKEHSAILMFHPMFHSSLHFEVVSLVELMFY